jgi:cation:H+ antiporter
MVYLTLILGLVLLTVGAELLVKNASRLAVNVGISPLVVGLTVVAFGTSAPELVVSVHSSLTGRPDVALGNVVGSNIFNVLFILGISALIVPLKVSQQLIRFDVPLMVFLSALVWGMCYDGQIGRIDGFFLTAGIVIYTVWSVVQSRRELKAEVTAQYEAEYGLDKKSASTGLWINVLLLCVGLGLLILGTRFFVESAVTIAKQLGVSELVIGLTIVAVGTSLPEVAASLAAAIRGERDIAVGNVIGSNIFNILCVLGFSSLASGGVTVSAEAFNFDLPVMVGVAIVCLPIFFIGQVVSRLNGLLFLGLYVAYTAYLIMKATNSQSTATFGKVMLWGVIPLVAIVLIAGVIRQVRRDFGSKAADIQA